MKYRLLQACCRAPGAGRPDGPPAPCGRAHLRDPGEV